jgi:hypothetical protein
MVFSEKYPLIEWPPVTGEKIMASQMFGTCLWGMAKGTDMDVA